MARSLLASFPHWLKPRPVQVKALELIQEKLATHDVFVISAPTATGKSNISATLAKALGDCAILTPTNQLVDQYKRDFRFLHQVKSKDKYWCTVRDINRAKVEHSCAKDLQCDGCEEYKSDIRKGFKYPWLVMNPYAMLANKLYRKHLVYDEAHLLIPIVQQLSAKVLWQHDYFFPSNIRSHLDLLRWLDGLPERKRQDPKLIKLREVLTSDKPRFLIKSGEKLWHGQERPCIELIPLDIRDEAPLLWPSSVKKLFLLSGTISPKDIEQMGLGDRRVCYINCDSPIPVEQRPVMFLEHATVNMSWKYQEQNLPEFCEKVEQILADHPTEKGLIHLTYGLARRLRELMPNHPRLVFHDNLDKLRVFREFTESKEPHVLVASGMYEGVDLPYDLARFQIVGKVPWPSLAEPATQYKAAQDPKWYAWETLKTVIQASGRVCRTPTDFGVTYILDTAFGRLYRDNQDLVPEWFAKAVVRE